MSRGPLAFAMCTATNAHEPHIYIRAIAGGEPGPVPTTTLRCPGRLIDAAKWDAAALPPGFTQADAVALMAIESGFSLQPWQFDMLAAYFPDPEEQS